MNRRGFLSGILAAAVAPAIVRADSLMRIVPRELLVEVSGVAIAARHQILRGEIGRYDGLIIHLDQRGPSKLLAALTPAERAQVDAIWQQKIDDMVFDGLRV